VREPVTASRRAALQIRWDVGRGLRLDVAMDRATRGLAPRDRAFVYELAYGVSRLRGRLDHLLSLRVRGGLERLDPRVLEVLRVGAYQILYMDGVPRYAAVSQSVAQARTSSGKGAGGLVNAVLRGVAEHGVEPESFPAFADDPLAHLETWGSHPRWLLERWLARWPAEDVRRLVETDNRKSPLYLVPLDGDVEGAHARLVEAGIGAQPVGRGSLCLGLDGGTDPVAALGVLPSFIQDPAANLVTRYADIPAGTKVADLCAAPGGKALAASAVASYTLAADRSQVRMRMVRDNARRTGCPLGMVVADARHPPLREVDVVLLDVPCTGTGTLGRHPDGRWRLDANALAEMVSLQGELLDAAAKLIPIGGFLIYSTCSLEAEENEEQVSAFLERRPDFTLAPSRAVPEDLLDDEGRLVVLPQRHGFDGAFAARLRRAS
jgi:16S rRNA (cytosine967-C5)-methyltransferase